MLQCGPTFEHLSTLVDKARTVKKPRCLNPTCSLHGNVESTGIIRYGFYRTTARETGRWCADAGRPTRFKPSSPSPTDAVRDGSAKLGHPVQNVTREHGLTPLPR